MTCSQTRERWWMIDFVCSFPSTSRKPVKSSINQLYILNTVQTNRLKMSSTLTIIYWGIMRNKKHVIRKIFQAHCYAWQIMNELRVGIFQVCHLWAALHHKGINYYSWYSKRLLLRLFTQACVRIVCHRRYLKDGTKSKKEERKLIRVQKSKHMIVLSLVHLQVTREPLESTVPLWARYYMVAQIEAEGWSTGRSSKSLIKWANSQGGATTRDSCNLLGIGDWLFGSYTVSLNKQHTSWTQIPTSIWLYVSYAVFGRL